MHNHSRCLVDNYEVVVFVNHIERQVLWHNACFTLGERQHYLDVVVGLNLVATTHRLAVYIYAPAFGGSLYAVARGAWKTN